MTKLWEFAGWGILAACLSASCGEATRSVDGGVDAGAPDSELDASDSHDATGSSDATSSSDAATTDGSSQDASQADDAGMDATSDAAPDAASDGGPFESGPGPAPDAGASTLTSAKAGLDFARLEVGVQSQTDTWTITNSGDASSGALTLVNPDPTDVLVTNGCSAALAPGASCNISVALKLTHGGPYTGWLRLQSAQSGALNLNLSANGAYRVTIAATGTGSVTSTSGAIACGATCTGLFDAGSKLTLQARTSNGSNHYFSGWSGAGCSGALRDCELTVSATSTISATFSVMTHNLVFVSASAFPTNRGGAAEYDSDCNAAASAAGINNADGNAYVAATTDAASSLQSRLGSARGWVRMDGKPFKDVFSNGQQDPVLNTVRYTERGEALGSSIRVMAGLPFDGAAYNCRNFTSTSSADTVASGFVEGGPGRWILNEVGGTYHLCSDGPFHVICLGKTKTAPVPATPVAGKLVWTSTGSYQAGGAAPDAVCQQDRPASVTTAAALVNKSDRPHTALLGANTRYVRPDGSLVGTGRQLAEVTSLESGIWQDAAGTYLASSAALVVTGGGVDSFAGTCGDWTSTSGMSASADLTSPEGESWWRANNLPCSTPQLRFYCVQTAP